MGDFFNIFLWILFCFYIAHILHTVENGRKGSTGAGIHYYVIWYYGNTFWYYKMYTFICNMISTKKTRKQYLTLQLGWRNLAPIRRMVIFAPLVLRWHFLRNLLTFLKKSFKNSFDISGEIFCCLSFRLIMLLQCGWHF